MANPALAKIVSVPWIIIRGLVHVFPGTAIISRQFAGLA